MENIAYAIFIGMTVLTGLLFVICTLKDPRRFCNSLLFLAFFTLLTFACIIFSDFHPLMPRLGILLVLIWIFLILIVPFLVFLLPAFVSWLSSIHIEQVFLKHMNQKDRERTLREEEEIRPEPRQPPRRRADFGINLAHYDKKPN